MAVPIFAEADHWAFRPLGEPAPKAAPGKSPVDRFILDALEKRGLAPAAPADRRTFLRRVYFDLLGLPPEPQQVDAFLADPDPRAEERLVDRLLASPHFGERWGRRWLDLARYADSSGQESDHDRPTAYHFRDFVIWALNSDLPYDTFVRWQIAGDEYEPGHPRAVAATGFLTAGPHTMTDTPMEEEKIRDRYNELDDILSTTGAALLGLTLGCARCHDHKYDPVPTRDYYRLLAVFNSGERGEVPLVPPAEARRRRDAEKEWKARLEAARKELDGWLAKAKKPLAEEVRKAAINRLKAGEEEKRILLARSPDSRVREIEKRFQKELAGRDSDYRALFSEEQRARWDALAAAVSKIEQEKPDPLPTAFAMADFGARPRESWLLDRGDFHFRKEPVELGFLTALTRGRPPAAYWSDAKAAGSRDDTTYQRRALAEWMTDVERGAGALLARVVVNRLWQGHFGEGLVRTVNDFGRRGEPATHPELLEWLASELVRGGWKQKPIHRLLVLSEAYRRGVALDPRAAEADPDNRLWWRRRPLRMESEVFRDSMLAVAGTLNPRVYGPAFKPPIQPEAMQARNVQDPYPADAKDSFETRRRTIYQFHKRVVQHPLLQAFDGPDASACCGRRNVTTVATQALAVLNEPFVRRRAAEFAGRLRAEAGADPAALARRAYLRALSREPTPAEIAASVRFLREREAARSPRDGGEAEILALTDFAQVLFGLNEFLYVD